MKIPKKPSQEPPLPSQDEVRRANVLREEMLSQFRTFGESLSIIREDVQSMKPELHTVKEDVALLKSAAWSHSNLLQGHSDVIRGHGDILRGHTDAINANTEAIRFMQTDLKSINQRLEVVEAKVAS